MGFFSWNCKGCGHPMLCSEAVLDKNKWMNDVVVLCKDGTVMRGSYDGYGRVNEREIDDCSPECYHQHCWDKAGRPIEYTGESQMSSDQGWFFDDNTHNITQP
jgi:hypothetical protein